MEDVVKIVIGFALVVGAVIVIVIPISFDSVEYYEVKVLFIPLQSERHIIDFLLSIHLSVCPSVCMPHALE